MSGRGRYKGAAGEHGQRPSVLDVVNQISGARMSFRSKTRLVQIAPGLVNDIANMFPVGVFPLGCTARVVTPVGGPTVGVAIQGVLVVTSWGGAILNMQSGANTDFLGATLSYPWTNGLPSTNETGIRLQTIGGAFDGTGSIRLTTFYVCFVPEGFTDETDPYQF